jgi:alkylhydroperoxidase family enzyme
MAVVNPLTKEQAAPAAHDIYSALNQKMGKVPNFFATMAHRPDVLNKFVPLYGAIINEGTVEPRYKELAYLKTSLVNGCEY